MSHDFGPDLEHALATERGYLLRLAHAQLRNAQWAEDVVQEAALAAWQSVAQFEGRSTLRTWLVGILRFKILDALRAQMKQAVSIDALEVQGELSALEDQLLFNAQGRWQEQPMAWWDDSGAPDSALLQKQVLHHVQWCLDVMPEKSAQVFLMREYLGCESTEIVHHTGLQAGHVRVILMRARLALRTCLEMRMAQVQSSNQTPVQLPAQRQNQSKEAA